MSATKDHRLSQQSRQVGEWLEEHRAQLVVEPKLSGYPWRELDRAAADAPANAYLYTRDPEIVNAAVEGNLTGSRNPPHGLGEAPLYKLKLTPELGARLRPLHVDAGGPFEAGRLFECVGLPSGTSIFHAPVRQGRETREMLVFHYAKGGVDPLLKSLRDRNGLLGGTHDPSLDIAPTPDGGYAVSLLVPRRLSEAILAGADNAVAPLADRLGQAPTALRQALQNGGASPEKLRSSLPQAFPAPQKAAERPPQRLPASPAELPKPEKRSLAEDAEWLRPSLIFTRLRRADGSVPRAVFVDPPSLPAAKRKTFDIRELANPALYSDALPPGELGSERVSRATLSDAAFTHLMQALGGEAAVRLEPDVRPFRLPADTLKRLGERSPVRLRPADRLQLPQFTLRAGHARDASGMGAPVLYVKASSPDALAWSRLPWPAEPVTQPGETPVVWRITLTEEVLGDVAAQIAGHGGIDFASEQNPLSDEGMRLVFGVKAVEPLRSGDETPATAPEPKGGNKPAPAASQVEPAAKPVSDEAMRRAAGSFLDGFASRHLNEAPRMLVARWTPPKAEDGGPRDILALRGRKETQGAEEVLRAAGLIEAPLPGMARSNLSTRAFWLTPAGATFVTERFGLPQSFDSPDKTILGNKIEQAFRDAERKAAEARADPVESALQHLCGRELRKATVRHPSPKALGRTELGTDALASHMAAVAFSGEHHAGPIADIAGDPAFRWSRIPGFGALPEAARRAEQLRRHAESTADAIARTLKHASEYRDWVAGLNGRHPVQLVIGNPTQQTVEALSVLDCERPHDVLTGSGIGGKDALIVYPSPALMEKLEHALGHPIPALTPGDAAIPSTRLEGIVARMFSPPSEEKERSMVSREVSPEDVVRRSLIHLDDMRGMLALAEPENPADRLPGGAVDERLAAQPMLCFRIRRKQDVGRLEQIREAFDPWLAEPRRYGPVEERHVTLAGEAQESLNALQEAETRRDEIGEYSRNLSILLDSGSSPQQRQFCRTALIHLNRNGEDTLRLEGTVDDRAAEFGNERMWPRLSKCCSRRIEEEQAEIAHLRTQLDTMEVTPEDRRQVDRHRYGATMPCLSIVRGPKGFYDAGGGHPLPLLQAIDKETELPVTVMLPIGDALADALKKEIRSQERNRLINGQLKDKARLPCVKMEELASLYDGHLRAVLSRG